MLNRTRTAWRSRRSARPRSNAESIPADTRKPTTALDDAAKEFGVAPLLVEPTVLAHHQEIRETVIGLLGERTGTPGTHSARLESLSVDRETLRDLMSSQARHAQGVDLDLAGWQARMHEDIALLESGVAEAPIALDDIVGTVGRERPRDIDWQQFLRFLAPIDASGIAQAMISGAESRSLRTTDLGTAMDLSLITWALAAQPERPVRRILEVGGGYGRLAEGFLACWPSSQVQYVLADAVPSSLAAAFTYLRSRFPTMDIQLAVEEPPRDTADVVLVPSWNAGAMDWIHDIDVFVNIESFQEMTPSYVARWLDLADRQMRSGAVAYVSNSRSYINTGDWPIPDDWELQVFTETPRSWSADHPTALYQLPGEFSSATYSVLRRATSAIWKVPPAARTSGDW